MSGIKRYAETVQVFGRTFNLLSISDQIELTQTLRHWPEMADSIMKKIHRVNTDQTKEIEDARITK